MNELMKKVLNFPFDASANGYQLDNMLVWIHWLMLVLFVGWGGFFVYTLWRFRSKRNPQANYHGAHHKGSTYVEVGVIVAEAILLLVFAFPIWANVVKAFPSEKESTVVKITGEQFAWNIHYPGDDGIFGRQDISFLDSGNPLGIDQSDPNAADDIITLNQLYLPVNKPVIFHVTSKDVIHGFGIYELRVKQDATPGLSIPFWCIPVKEGKFEIVCSQLCGLGHYRMRGFVNVVSPEKFEEWKAEQLEEEDDEEDIW